MFLHVKIIISEVFRSLFFAKKQNEGQRTENTLFTNSFYEIVSYFSRSCHKSCVSGIAMCDGFIG